MSYEVSDIQLQVIPTEVKFRESAYKLLYLGTQKENLVLANGDRIAYLKNKLGKPIKRQMAVLTRRKAVLDKEIEQAQAKGQKPDEAKLKEQGAIKEKLDGLENQLKNVGAGNKEIKQRKLENSRLNRGINEIGLGLSNFNSGDLADYLNRDVAERDKLASDKESTASSFVTTRGGNWMQSLPGFGQLTTQ